MKAAGRKLKSIVIVIMEKLNEISLLVIHGSLEIGGLYLSVVLYYVDYSLRKVAVQSYRYA